MYKATTNATRKVCTCVVRSPSQYQRLALRVYSVPGKAARTKVQTQLYRFRRFETGFGSVIVDHQVLSKYAKKKNRFWIDY